MLGFQLVAGFTEVNKIMGISLELIQSVVELNNKILTKTVVHPATLALLLEEIATDAWNEASELGTVTWQEAEDIPPSLRID